MIDFVFFFQAEDGIRDTSVTGVQTCALPIYTVNDLIVVLISLTVLPLQMALVTVISLYIGTKVKIGRASCRERV